MTPGDAPDTPGAAGSNAEMNTASRRLVISGSSLTKNNLWSRGSRASGGARSPPPTRGAARWRAAPQITERTSTLCQFCKNLAFSMQEAPLTRLAKGGALGGRGALEVAVLWRSRRSGRSRLSSRRPSRRTTPSICCASVSVSRPGIAHQKAVFCFQLVPR
ncbi:hypothetical protein EYF80_054649 [Liparis tanakae]|uniref:Uncharacterized protein n=1 Tax=Liparis tanakae TaxID=230148 RepID=A0A4Z2F212_9TELE|nr:hypothetical protein EYF80_054649 [Liparis tanakae]